MNLPYATIALGVEAVVPGGTVIAAGNVRGQITVSKSVTLLGDPGDASAGPGPNAPVIDGGSAPGDAFLIANGVSNVTIQGFEMRNFTSPDSMASAMESLPGKPAPPISPSRITISTTWVITVCLSEMMEQPVITPTGR